MQCERNLGENVSSIKFPFIFFSSSPRQLLALTSLSSVAALLSNFDPLSVFLRMATGKEQPTPAATAPAISSCRKKKSEEATFLEDVKDHIDEFINASMDEHKTCFKKTIQKMFGMSKVVAERNSQSKEVESSLPLQTTIAD